MSFYNNKYTKWLVGALVLMNFFLLFVAFYNPTSNRGEEKNLKGEKIHHFIKNELNLSDEQAVQFKELRKAYFIEKKESWKSIRTLKKGMMDVLSTETPDTAKAESIAQQIGQLEIEKEKKLINHYLKLQSLCTPEQREKLASVFKRAMKRDRHHSRKGKSKRKDCN